MKLPIKQGAIAGLVGVGTYVGGVQLQKASTWAAQHWYAVPSVAIGGGLLIASKKKHMPIGIALIAAGSAIGYFAYAAAKGQPTMQAATGAAPAASTTQTTSQVTPASTVPTTQPGTAAQPQSTDQSGINPVQTAQNLFGGGDGTGTGTGGTDTGTTSGGADTGGGSTDGSTPQTAGYNAGALLARRVHPMGRHAGALIPNRHLQRIGRHAGHYEGGDAAGLET